MAGAPSLASELLSDITLETGRFWHRFMGEALVKRGIPFMQEVDLTPWLPKGWGGRADWLIWHPEYQAFALGDLKTKKGEGMRFVSESGISEEYIWQLSAYWYAAREMGLPLIEGLAIYYLPKNDAPNKYERIEPKLVETRVLPEDEVLGEMEYRRARVDEYLLEVKGDGKTDPGTLFFAEQMGEGPGYVVDSLEPPLERIQKYWWQKKTQTFDVKLVPHWSTAYCPYPNELCDCSEQGTTKIGEYRLDGLYKPRKGYEDIEPTVRPTEREFLKRMREANEPD